MKVREVRLVYGGEREVAFDPSRKITDPDQSAELFADMRELTHEEFRVVMLDGRNRPIGISTVSQGTLTTSLVHPREVFAPAIHQKARSIIIAHNHPSGDEQPSNEDMEVTKRLVECGALLGIQVLDHLVMGRTGFYYSFARAGTL